MGRFRFEDYRQPWETGPHWELKREFMEKYCDTFPEDRLLCLAQAYFNIVMMNCRYPDEVMKQINHLAKPLQMRKKFQEGTDDLVSQTQEEIGEKRKMMYESFGTPFKQIKFCKGESKSDTASDSTNSTQNLTQNVSTNSVQIYEQMVAQSQYNHSNNTTEENKVVTSSNNQLEENKEYNRIIKALGLNVIQNLAQEIRKLQTKVPTPLLALQSACQKLKISDIAFKIDVDPKSSKKSLLFQSQCCIKGCVIACEKSTKKKKAKFLSADTAVNTLMTIATLMPSSSKEDCANKNVIESDASVLAKCSTTSATSVTSNSSVKNTPFKTDSDDAKLQLQTTKESFVPDFEASNVMKMLQAFREKLLQRERKKHPNIALNEIVYNLRIQHYVSFKIEQYDDFKTTAGYICKFFLKNTLISCERGVHEKDSKHAAIKSAFNKIENLSNYEIRNGELKEQDSTTASVSHDEPTVITENKDSIKQPFILNQIMFDSSMRDGFVLVDNFALKPVSQRNVRSLIVESASFCHKSFEYNFEDVRNPEPLKKIDVLLDKVIVGTGVAATKGEAKIAACKQAVDMLMKKYYTLKVKNEYIEGFIITRNQVFEGESFSSGALTDSNIGCKMLKNMGWTGGGLGASGITEPVEAHGQHNFGHGLGYWQGKTDTKLFKKRIQSMLQDYSKSNSLSDLIFSKDFTKDERLLIHRMAKQCNLHTASRGKDANRFLTVRRKYTTNEILTYLKDNGGSNSKFDLIDCSITPCFEYSDFKI